MSNSTPDTDLDLETDSDDESTSLSPPPLEEPVFMSGGTYRGIQRNIPRQRRSIVEYLEEEDDAENEEDEDEDEDENEEQDEVEIEIGYDSNGEEIPIPCKLYDSDEDISIEIEYDMGDPELHQMLALAAAEEAENTDGENCSSEDVEIDDEPEPKPEEIFFDEEGNQITKRDMLLAAVQKIACPSPPREATPDPSPSITFLAIGEDMCEAVMRNICPDAKFLGIGRLDGWMYCVDEAVEGVCCYRNILPAERQREENGEYDTKESVVYGILWEVHESTIYTLLNGQKREEDPKYDMARVNVMRLSCENGFGPAFGKGWGLKRELREEGIEEDVLIFTGTPGGIGLGEGYNDEVNKGIVEGCMMGIPDEWVESDVRMWVKYPDGDSPIHLD